MRRSEAAVRQLAENSNLQEAVGVALGRVRPSIATKRYSVTPDPTRVTVTESESFRAVVQAISSTHAVETVALARGLNPYHLKATPLKERQVREGMGRYQQTQKWSFQDQDKANRFSLLCRERLGVIPTWETTSRGFCIGTVSGVYGDGEVASLAAACGGQVFRYDTQSGT